MMITIYDIGWNQGLQKALTLFSNVSSIALQRIVNYSKYLPANKINMHELTWGKVIIVFIGWEWKNISVGEMVCLFGVMLRISL